MDFLASMVQLFGRVQISLTESEDIFLQLNFIVSFGPIQNYFGLVKTIWMGLFGPTAGQVISKLQILIKF